MKAAWTINSMNRSEFHGHHARTHDGKFARTSWATLNIYYKEMILVMSINQYHAVYLLSFSGLMILVRNAFGWFALDNIINH